MILCLNLELAFIENILQPHLAVFFWPSPLPRSIHDPFKNVLSGSRPLHEY